MALSHEQRRVAFHIYDVGRKRGMNRRQILAALETGLGETHLTNPRGGSGTSAGWRQEINTYGSVGKRRNVRGGAGRFYDEIKGFKGPSYALAYQAQRPAQPSNYYAQFKPQAKHILSWLEKTYGGGKSSPGGNSDPRRTVLSGKLRTIPGVSHEADRQQAKLGLLSSTGSKMPSQGQLLNLASNLRDLQDEPAQQTFDITKKTVGGGGGSAPNAKSRDAGNSLNRMVRIADAWDKAKAPYAWGGGHGGKPAKAGTPVDCSGYVSAILGIAPRTSGALAHWGKPGRGKRVTVWANSGHVLIQIGHRWYATSHENPGGGAGRRSKPSAAYLASFTARHPAGL